VSRQAPEIAKEPRRKRRLHTTGPNQQLNIKASAKTVERLARKWPTGDIVRVARNKLSMFWWGGRGLVRGKG